MCECAALVNKSLADSEHPNTMVETPMWGPQITFVVTCKRDERIRGKPKRVFASYCPFCGVKYEAKS